ncbi:Hypothetical predicted protein [Mytilus galloprovincialis]|uniref:Uncharacterized protein n=1 Tax=Mytilus galloprovincialis TaxID=29158 RepID=A0A8B6D7J5_MYTGA|nr:Hypothetical predicted protein [Mytilus galloprovincialis]
MIKNAECEKLKAEKKPPPTDEHNRCYCRERRLVRDYLPFTHSESIRLWATKSCGEPVSPLVSLTLPQTSTPASLPPSYHYQPTMSSTTTLASIPTSYHHLPTMSSTIPASHLSSQTMSCFRTATAHTHLPVSNMSSSYPTTTATCQAQQSTLPSVPTFQMSTLPSTTHFYTAEPLDQSFNHTISIY